MVRITGAEVAIGRLKGLAGQRKVELVGQALFAGGDLIRAEVSRLITQHSAGGHSGGKHQHIRSLPGEPPNEEFGNLRIGQEVNQLAPLRVEYSSNAPHAVPLEAGTSKMAARPSVGPAVRLKRKEIVALVEKAVSIAVRKRK